MISNSNTLKKITYQTNKQTYLNKIHGKYIETRKEKRMCEVSTTYVLFTIYSLKLESNYIQSLLNKIPYRINERPIQGTHIAKALSNCRYFPAPLVTFHSNYYHLVQKTKDKKIAVRQSCPYHQKESKYEITLTQ